MPNFYKTRLSMVVKGPPGCGKTDTMYAFCAHMSRVTGAPFGLVVAITAGMDPVEIRGIGIPMKNQASGKAEVRFTEPTIWPNKVTTRVFVDGVQIEDYDGPIPKQGLLFADELTQADADVQKVMAQVLLDRQIGEHKLLPGWVVWGAGNRLSDKAGVVRTLSQLQNRAMELEVFSDFTSWHPWALENNVPALIISFAKSNAGQVFIDKVPAEEGPYTTARSLVSCARTLMSFKKPGASEISLPDDTVAGEIIAGWLGKAMVGPLLSHIRLANDLPDIDDVLKNPMGTMVPGRLDARFVMATSLAMHSRDAKKARVFIKYVERMDLELQQLYVKAVVMSNPATVASNEFSVWIGKNQKLLIAANG